MKDKLPKNILLPFLVGIGFCFFVILGFNAYFFSGHTYWNIFAVLLGVVILYVSLIGILKNSNNLWLGMGGFYVGRIFLGIIFLLTGFFIQKYFWEKTREYKSLLEKENVILIPDFEECHRIKYGKFLAGFDTIIRYSGSKKDMEEIISPEGSNTYTIKWLDSCTYYRLEERSNSVKDIVKMGNFQSLLHEMYIKPAALHYIAEERIIQILTIQVDTGRNKEEIQY